METIPLNLCQHNITIATAIGNRTTNCTNSTWWTPETEQNNETVYIVVLFLTVVIVITVAFLWKKLMNCLKKAWKDHHQQPQPTNMQYELQPPINNEQVTNYDAMNDTPNDTNVGPRPEDDMNYDIMDSMHDIDDISIMEGLLPNVRTDTTNQSPNHATLGNRITTSEIDDPPPYEVIDMRPRLDTPAQQNRELTSQTILDDIMPMSGHTAVQQTDGTNNVMYNTNDVNISSLPEYTSSCQPPSYNETETGINNESGTSNIMNNTESDARRSRTPPPSYNDVMEDILHQVNL